MTPEDRAELSRLVVGDVIALSPATPAQPGWTVRAADGRFVILSRQSDLGPAREIYTIADLERGIRGPCDFLAENWNMGSPSGAGALLDALHHQLQLDAVTDASIRSSSSSEPAPIRVSAHNTVPLSLASPPAQRGFQ